MLRRDLLAGLVVVLSAATANAGQMYVALIIDPTTTAGAGIATIPRANSTDTFAVTSTLSGAGKWHLYVLDDVTGSFGLAGFSIPVNGSATGHLNRSPNATFTNYGDADETLVQSSGSTGYSDALVRSGVGINPSNPVQGNQVIGSPNDIPGMGQTTGNFNGTPNLAAPTDHRTWGGVTSGQWGNYATAPSAAYISFWAAKNPAWNGAIAAMNAGKKWIFVGEGSYTDSLAIMSALGSGTAINYYNSNVGGQLGFVPLSPNFITQTSNVPEPATLLLIGMAIASFWGVRRRLAISPLIR